MIELKGKYNTAKVYTDNIDNETISQVTNLLNQESIGGSKIRIMPDTHAGAGCVIGTTMTLTDKVIPNLVGVDIGCGMTAVKLNETESEIDLAKLDDIIHKYVPCGGNVHEDIKMFKTSLDVEHLECYGKHGANIREALAYQSVGTLGGGNHFIEVDKDSSGALWLVIHTGSRHLGLEVCNYYQNIGYQRLVDKTANCWTSEDFVKTKRKGLIANLKSNGQQKLISEKIKELDNKIKDARDKAKVNVPFDLAYVEGQDFKDYIHDMNLVQKHASCNRDEIARVILKYFGLSEADRFETIHNYIDVDNMILRKGSVSAQKGERLIIPINMRDGSLICVGKGNEDWNYSAPHGAGRLMSRSKAKELVSMKEYNDSMEGIYSTSVNQNTIDESPMAYKPMEEIIANIEPTVDIIDIIKPIYNFKAGE